MATITEQNESGSGDDGGIVSNPFAVRTFNVLKDANTENAWELVRDLEAPLGSRHPRRTDNPPLVVLRYSQGLIDDSHPLFWEVDAIYGNPVVIASKWLVTGSTSFETENRAFDNRGRLVYQPSYKEDPDGQFTASGRNGEIKLSVVSDRSIRRTFQVRAPRPHITFSAVIPDLSQLKIGAVNFMVGTVNSRFFFGAPERTLFFDDFTYTERKGSFAEFTSAVTGLTWDVSITFTFNPNGWAEREFDFWVDADGNELVIGNTERTYDMLSMSNFTAPFSILNNTPIRIPR